MKKETDFSRRNFLKGTVMGAGALTAGFGAGLVLPGTAHAAGAPPALPLPYCEDAYGSPTSTPATDNVTVLDVEEVRVRAWYAYSTGNG